MARRVLVLSAVVALIALLTYGVVAQAPDATIDEALAKGETTEAPGFALDVLQPATEGGPRLPPIAQRAFKDGHVSLEELRGVPVALNFWASWCEPCRTEARTLERGWQRFAPKGALVLGLNMQDVTEDARSFLRSTGVTYPSVREADDQAARNYGATGLPETYFISARGAVVGHVIGQIDDRQMTVGMQAAITGRPSQVSTGGERRDTR